MASATGLTMSTSHCEGGGKGSSIVVVVLCVAGREVGLLGESRDNSPVNGEQEASDIFTIKLTKKQRSSESRRERPGAQRNSGWERNAFDT